MEMMCLKHADACKQMMRITMQWTKLRDVSSHQNLCNRLQFQSQGKNVCEDIPHTKPSQHLRNTCTTTKEHSVDAPPTDHQLRCMGELPKYHNKISPSSGMAIALHDFATSILHFRRSNQLLHFIHQTLALYFCGILSR